jgi:hypothetical protein
MANLCFFEEAVALFFVRNCRALFSEHFFLVAPLTMQGLAALTKADALDALDALDAPSTVGSRLTTPTYWRLKTRDLPGGISKPGNARTGKPDRASKRAAHRTTGVAQESKKLDEWGFPPVEEGPPRPLGARPLLASALVARAECLIPVDVPGKGA